jgi:hypothetical protein
MQPFPYNHAARVCGRPSVYAISHGFVRARGGIGLAQSTHKIGIENTDRTMSCWL